MLQHEHKVNDIVSDESTDNSNKTSTNGKYRVEIVWRNVIGMGFLHIMAIHGFYCALTVEGRFKDYWKTIVWFWFIAFSSSIGVLTGAHRLWAHRGYKAKWPLRVILMILETMALQNDIYEWCRDHRVHHKYSDTDADPHNSNRYRN